MQSKSPTTWQEPRLLPSPCNHSENTAKHPRWQRVSELCGDNVDGAAVGSTAEVLPPPAVAHAHRLDVGVHLTAAAAAASAAEPAVSIS
jgi:hypothetical protein